MDNRELGAQHLVLDRAGGRRQGRVSSQKAHRKHSSAPCPPAPMGPHKHSLEVTGGHEAGHGAAPQWEDKQM